MSLQRIRSFQFADDPSRIFDDSPEKGRLIDVSLRLNGQDAKDTAARRKNSKTSVRIHYRRVRVDGVSFPVWLIVEREKLS